MLYRSSTGSPPEKGSGNPMVMPTSLLLDFGGGCHLVNGIDYLAKWIVVRGVLDGASGAAAAAPVGHKCLSKK